MEKLSEDVPTNNISSGNIADPKNKLLGAGKTTLRRWLKGQKEKKC